MSSSGRDKKSKTSSSKSTASSKRSGPRPPRRTPEEEEEARLLSNPHAKSREGFDFSGAEPDAMDVVDATMTMAPTPEEEALRRAASTVSVDADQMKLYICQNHGDKHDGAGPAPFSIVLATSPEHAVAELDQTLAKYGLPTYAEKQYDFAHVLDPTQPTCLVLSYAATDPNFFYAQSAAPQTSEYSMQIKCDPTSAVVYACADHDTNAPIPAASLVIHSSREEAQRMLDYALVQRGCKPHAEKPYTLVGYGLQCERAVLLSDGTDSARYPRD